MTEQLTLFNFPATETIKPIHDPYWDEIVLNADGRTPAEIEKLIRSWRGNS
jgi:hypothetical protein